MRNLMNNLELRKIAKEYGLMTKEQYIIYILRHINTEYENYIIDTTEMINRSNGHT